MEDIKKAITFLIETKAGCKMLKDKELSNVCDIALAALEKQVPKKVSEKSFFKAFKDIIGECPACEQAVPLQCSYCPRCGQALDWSDENDE